MKKFFATVIALVMFAAQVEAVELTSADSQPLQSKRLTIPCAIGNVHR